MQKRIRSKSQRRTAVNRNSALDASTSQAIMDLVSKIPDVDYKTQYLHSSFLAKFADPDPAMALERRTAAIEKWRATELLNACTNDRLRNTDRDFNILPRLTFRKFVKHCQRIVAHVLGELNDDLVVGSFSGGASTSRRRTEAHPGFKFSDKADVTEDAVKFVGLLHQTAPFLRTHNIFYNLTEVEGAVLFTVPKSSSIDRCACKEPDINMYLQKGVGARIRRRLLRYGINLNDQGINRDLAREGSITGNLATLDLSSASDSISIELVRLLLPPLWFEYLNDIRSRSVVIDGDATVTEMFSSMGNGFTFELESLLFFSICKTVLYFEGIPGRLSVYGDDIICPSRGYDMIVWTLKYFGFRANEDKSFATGPFRESCGGHYHNGEDVTPFYLKRPAKRLTDLIRVTNQLRRWAFSSISLPVLVDAPEVYHLWCNLRDRVPSDLWGGSDYELDTQLVTPDSPRQRLVRVNVKKKVPSLGLYSHWQNSNWNRTVDRSDPSMDVTDANSFCRKRPAPQQWSKVTDTKLFVEEME